LTAKEVALPDKLFPYGYLTFWSSGAGVIESLALVLAE